MPKEISDFKGIGAAFHRWVKSNAEKCIKLETSEDFCQFIEKDFRFYAKWYKFVADEASVYNEEFEYIYYNAHLKITYQYMLILSCIKPEDDKKHIECKINLITGYLDIYAAIKIVNGKSDLLKKI